MIHEVDTNSAIVRRHNFRETEIIVFAALMENSEHVAGGEPVDAFETVVGVHGPLMGAAVDFAVEIGLEGEVL